MRLLPALLMLAVLPAGAAQIDTCFVPGQDCTAVVVHEIDGARHEVLLQAYGFTSPDIADALVEAERRGVTVKAIFDKSDRPAKSHKKRSLAADLIRAGIPVLVDTVPGIAHNKVLVIDGDHIVTGSFNFTTSAQKRNAENLLVIHDPEVAARYRKNWMDRQAEAEDW